MTVYIVGDSDLGWDSVVAIFTKESDAEACAKNRGNSSFVTDGEVDSPDYENGVYIG